MICACWLRPSRSFLNWSAWAIMPRAIANINIRMGDEELLKPLIDIPRMAEKGVDMLHRSLTAFCQRGYRNGPQYPCWKMISCDALYNQIYRELMTFIIADPKTIERANWLLWVAHNLERFADRVTNILRAHRLHCHRRVDRDHRHG